MQIKRFIHRIIFLLFSIIWLVLNRIRSTRGSIWSWSNVWLDITFRTNHKSLRWENRNNRLWAANIDEQFGLVKELLTKLQIIHEYYSTAVDADLKKKDLIVKVFVQYICNLLFCLKPTHIRRFWCILSSIVTDCGAI